MIFGFNTDVRVGKVVFHVQTEDRGKGNPVIDTTIYVKGQVLAKRAASYQNFLASPDFNEADLQEMLERQHKLLIEEIRNGSLAELAQLEARPSASGISVQLLNPSTFLRGTMANLEVTVVKRPDGQPVEGANLRVLLSTGGEKPFRFDAVTDPNGRARLQFHMPRLGPGGAQLVVEATSPEGRDEIKYNVRPRRKRD